MDDLCATRARQPDVAVVEAAVQVTAALVFAYKGHQSVEDSWHRGGENITAVNAPATDDGALHGCVGYPTDPGIVPVITDDGEALIVDAT